MTSRSLLDDPEKAALAWARYRRVMQWMTLVTFTLVAGSLWVLYRGDGTVSIDGYIAAAFGVAGMMLLSSAVMGFIFLTKRKKSGAVPLELPDDDREG